VVAVVVVAGGPAHGHAFLAATEPAHGERLAESPDGVALQFSEPVALGVSEVAVERHAAGPVATAAPAAESGGRVVHVALPPLEAGVYVVSFHVVSAVDGHETAGEFAFGVGAAGGELPERADETAALDRADVVASGLFLLGLTIGIGGLAGPRLLPAAAGDRPRLRGRRWLRVGLTIAVAGALGAAGRAVVDIGSSGPGMPEVAIVGVVALLLAALTAATSPAWLAAVPMAGSIAAWSTRSHAATADGIAGWLLAAIHLLAAVLWAGALLYLVVAVTTVRGSLRSTVLRQAWSYARLAAVTVVVLGVTGAAAAWRLLDEPASLWTIGYGRLILAKTILFGLALVLAGVARRRALPAGRPRLLGRLTGGEAAAVVAALVVAAALASTAPPRLAADTTELLLGPPPVEGPVAHAAARANTVLVDVRAGDGRLDVQVLGGAGGIDGAGLALTASLPDGTEIDLHPRPCGAGCFTQALELREGPTTLQGSVQLPDREGGAFTATLAWPPAPEHPDRFDEVLASMRAVTSMRVAETVWTGSASGEPSAGQGFELRGEEFLALVPYGGGGVIDVRPLPDDPSSLQFYLPGSRTLFTVWLDERGRITRQHFVSPSGNEIVHQLHYPGS
jgi:methionine-rich copper-binding protein CopC/putative copper export protein